MQSRNHVRKCCILAIYSVLYIISGVDLSGQSYDNRKVEDTLHDIEPLYMLTYDHGGLVLWGTDHFSRTIRNAVDWLKLYPGFKIGLDNEAYTYDFLALHDTVLFNELRNYLKKYSGRFGIGTCTYGQPLSQFINEESNIRQISYAMETDQTLFNYKPQVYLMSEHAMHNQIPQILVGFGFKGAIMRTHFMMYGYNPTFDSPIGWWIGSDESRIPAIPTYKGEGSGFGWVTEDNLILTRYPGPECDEPLEHFQKKFSGISPLLATRADDSDLRQEGLVKEYEGKPGFKWLLLDEIFPTFPIPEDEFKTLPNDFHVRMPWGYCGNEIWNMSRKAEVRLLTAERLAALESLLGGNNHEAELQIAWKNLLVAQHHDIQICGILKDSRRFLPTSIGISDSIINLSLNYAALQMEGGNLGQVTVFNPLSWTRKEWIDVTVPLPGGVENFIVQKGEMPAPFELLHLEHQSGTDKNLAHLRIYTEIPALAFQSFSIVSARQSRQTSKTIEFDNQNFRITNPFWIIDLDKNGGISAIISRLTGRQMIKNQRSGYFAGVINGTPCESNGKWDLDTIMQSGNQITVLENGLIDNIPYRFEMTLNSSSPRIDFKAIFRFNDEKIGRVSENKREIESSFLHEEKLRFKVKPALGIGTTGIRDLPFTVAETEDNYVEGNYWTALADGHSGMAFFNRGNMGSIHESDGSFSIPLAYAMYYIWRTVMLNGDYTYEFALYPFEGKWEEAGLHQEALEYTFPCIAIYTSKGSAKSGNEIRLFDINSSDIVLSALYTKGNIPFIRMYESKGINSDLQLHYLQGPVEFTEVNLAGEVQGRIISSILFRPWQIRTLRFLK